MADTRGNDNVDWWLVSVEQRREIKRLRAALKEAPRPNQHASEVIDWAVVYMDWYFKTRGAALALEQTVQRPKETP